MAVGLPVTPSFLRPFCFDLASPFQSSSLPPSPKRSPGGRGSERAGGRPGDGHAVHEPPPSPPLSPSFSVPSLLEQSNVDSGSGDIPREHSTCVAPRSRVNDRARVSRRAAERRARKSFYCRRGALRVKERRGDGRRRRQLPPSLLIPPRGFRAMEQRAASFSKRRENFKCNERCSSPPPDSLSPSSSLPRPSHMLLEASVM